MKSPEWQTTLDWFGERSPFQPQVAYSVSKGRLRFQFRAEKCADCDRRYQRGDFVEGLWERDVAEFFVAGEGSVYQEINISPTGAWWSASFTGYRSKPTEIRFEPLITVEESDDRWAVTFEASLDSFRPWRKLAPSQRLFSPTAILYDSKPNYFAWNHSGGGEPDFHRRELFQPLVRA
jgi:hypothetical protein